MPHKKEAVAVPAVEVNPNAVSYNLEQVCAVTGLLLWQVRMAIWKGHLSAKKIGRNLIVLRGDCEKFIAGQPTVAPKTDKEWMQKRQANRAVRERAA
jgi:hypothetical protein